MKNLKFPLLVTLSFVATTLSANSFANEEQNAPEVLLENSSQNSIDLDEASEEFLFGIIERIRAKRQAKKAEEEAEKAAKKLKKDKD